MGPDVFNLLVGQDAGESGEIVGLLVGLSLLEPQLVPGIEASRIQLHACETLDGRCPLVGDNKRAFLGVCLKAAWKRRKSTVLRGGGALRGHPAWSGTPQLLELPFPPTPASFT